MFRLRTLTLWVSSIALAVIPGLGWAQPEVGDMQTDFTLSGEAYKPSATRLWVFAVTIGQDWSGFPVHETHDFDANALQVSAAPLYVTGYSTSDGLLAGQWIKYPQPVAIKDPDYFPWLTTQRILGLQLFERQGWNCCWYHGCPALPNPPNPDPGSYQLCNTGDCCPSGQCPGARLYESSDFPVDSNGNITLTDFHGGSVSHMWGELHGLFSIDGQFTEVRWVFTYHRPGRFLNLSGSGATDVPPGATTQFRYRYPFGGVNVTIEPEVLMVHHVSPDQSWSSRGAVDASDYANFASNLGKAACYGMANEPNPMNCNQPCGWWWSDMTGPTGTPDGCTDASDLAFVASYTTPYGCEIGKAVAAEVDKARLLQWFGIEYTGKQIPVGIGGALIPEVVVVDQEQMDRAIQDPYGYLNKTTSSVETQSWSRIKQLYRYEAKVSARSFGCIANCECGVRGHHTRAAIEPRRV